MSNADLLARYRTEARAAAKDFGFEPTDEQIEGYAQRMLTTRTEIAADRAARPRRTVTAIPEWLSHEPSFDAQGKPFGRRYFTADGYDARPGLGRLAQGSRPNRWYVYGPDNYESVVMTIAEMIATIEYGRNRPGQR